MRVDKRTFEKLMDVPTDFKITVDDECEEFHVHKLLLSIHSPVFRAMFANDWKETRSGFINLQVDKDVVKNVLMWIYTNKLDKKLSYNLVSEIYDFSDQYFIEKLKEVCAEILIDPSLERLLIFNKQGLMRHGLRRF